MKKDKNREKSKMIKSLIMLNMLQQPSCFININKTSNKKPTNIKPNNLNIKKNTEVILPLQEVSIVDVSENINPIQDVTFENDTESILPICDKLSMTQFLVILRLLQQSYYNENINKTLKNSSTNIKEENRVIANKLSLINSKDKLNIKYILPKQEVIIEDDTEGTNKKGEINITTNDIYKISEKIDTNCFDNLISTIPIIIAEKNIDIPIESTFRLKNAALDIKSMKKDIYLTNSRLIPLTEKDDISFAINGKLFLEGFVRNKLDFSVAKGVNDNIINLDTECVIIYIPFKCTTLIKYKVPPVLSKRKVPDYIPIYISSDCLNINKDFNEYLGKKNIQSSEYINCDAPPINCEIEKARIHETYTLVDKMAFSEDFPLEISFHTIKENILINLSLTLIQNQDIAINYRKKT
ncbi:MAG TPA: hypothetical protein VIM70_10505 [Clostridium sp.]|uniref:DUF7852 domain-containing protein n=1 Tax=Clostridium sp. TaxID=1506 RepID=UPI002F93AB9F